MVVMKKRRSRCKRPRGFDISNCQCVLEVPSLDILSTLLQPCSETAALLNFKRKYLVDKPLGMTATRILSELHGITGSLKKLIWN